MSLKSALALVDAKLEALYHKKTPDHTKLRTKAIKTLDTVKKQFGSTEPSRGRKVWKAANDVVAFTPGYSINGEKTVYVPSSRFIDFITNIEKAISDGELDDMLIGGDDAPTTTATGRVRKPRGPLSAEALEARRKKMSANKK